MGSNDHVPLGRSVLRRSSTVVMGGVRMLLVLCRGRSGYRQNAQRTRDEGATTKMRDGCAMAARWTTMGAAAER